MQAYWTRWEKWMQKHAPKLPDTLNPGVAPATVDALERLIGSKLPADFKSFYAIHNGQQRVKTGLVDADQLLPVEDMITQWHHWKNVLDSGGFIYNEEIIASTPDTGIKSDWWNPLWIPITSDGFGNHLCIDLDPAPEGQYGQIITVWHEDSHRGILAPSFEAWMHQYITAIEKGEYVFVKKWGIVHKDTFLNYND
ncbi:SMI1/KNR4 family protein [Chitinophaga nivalis]|uniref:SMI1/KNR4 family protein n=1 Tax=Chitinophaga nivalis TaxID=2991709 RepID=A0ABT3IWL0_9BACT|nr:SMI1/KNR4 family protein [Chitinophaga nivalis]MCW3462022.1 SMI1/KNR4 family protein [Chitinophaga nivalis]MCW3488286.1 SMI1/KNR4 family protein [Chitinophaga nivalis]